MGFCKLRINGQNRIPRLRFPGFYEEWEEKKLGEIGEFLGGGTPSSSNEGYWNGNIPWISSSDLKENDVNAINISRYITEEAINNSATKLCKAPTVHIVSRVGVGKVAYSSTDLCTSQDFVNIVNFNCDGVFLSYLLSVIMLQSASNTQGTSIKGISSIEIKAKKIILPSVGEQQNIASFLKKLDQRISTQNKIIVDLKSLIKISSKFIFDQKFKLENIDYLSFSKIKLGELSESIVSGKSNLTNLTDGKYPVYGSTGIISFSNNFTHTGKRILIARVGANAGYIHLVDGDYSITDNALILSITDKNIDIDFIYYYLLNINLNKLVFGSGQPLLTGRQLKEIEIYLPTFSKQKWISSILNSLNLKIEIEKQILKSFEHQKQYLLQNLFI